MTIRATLADLIALFPDNSAQEITESDIRDLAETAWQFGIQPWASTAHAAGNLVWHAETEGNSIFMANAAIPDGTAFRIGATGRTWRRVIDGRPGQAPDLSGIRQVPAAGETGQVVTRQADGSDAYQGLPPGPDLEPYARTADIRQVPAAGETGQVVTRQADGSDAYQGLPPGPDLEPYARTADIRQVPRGGSDGDVLTWQADNTVAFAAIPSGGGGSPNASEILKVYPETGEIDEDGTSSVVLPTNYGDFDVARITPTFDQPGGGIPEGIDVKVLQNLSTITLGAGANEGVRAAGMARLTWNRGSRTLTASVVSIQRLTMVKYGVGPRGAGVPTGGAAGDVLKKNSATDDDTAWGPIREVPAGGNAGDVLTIQADGTFAWQAPSGGGGSTPPPASWTRSTMRFGINSSAALPASPSSATDDSTEDHFALAMPALPVGSYYVLEAPSGKDVISIQNAGLPGAEQIQDWTQSGRIWSVGPASVDIDATTWNITTRDSS